MKELLDEALAEGEALRWAGVSQPFKLLDGPNRRRTLVFWGVAIAVLLFLTVGYLVVCGVRGIEVKPPVFLFTVGIPALIFVDPIRDYRQVLGQIYAVTNRRALICHKNINTPDKTRSLPIESIDRVQRLAAFPGNQHILVGSALDGAPASKLMRISGNGKLDKEDRLVGLVFYNLTEEDSAKVFAAV
ncbi:MAG: hypothetical protein LBR44_05225 [Clostridiales Family XIII bacterium]|nr:hypothetical protein [Clostridiales Family XIII bacterium]